MHTIAQPPYAATAGEAVGEELLSASECQGCIQVILLPYNSHQIKAILNVYALY